MLECVVNISEGRNSGLLDRWCSDLGPDVLDLHVDPDHNRSVFTLVGETAPRALARLAVAALDLGAHAGVHPRLGVVDVVPFVPLEGSTMHDACRARDGFATWAATELGVPCFLYGPLLDGPLVLDGPLGDNGAERTLPDVRRRAWGDLSPDTGPARPHASAGAICVGARRPLVAYNVWLSRCDLATTRAIASVVRTTEMRTLGLQVGAFTQVSMNLVEPGVTGPMEAYDRVATEATRHGAVVERAELVGLVPAAVLGAIPEGRWGQLDLSEDRTIEARLARRQSAGTRRRI